MSPTKLRTACAQQGCPALINERRCPEHKRAETRRYDQQRGSSSARGYGVRWRKYRTWFLSQTANIFCATGCGQPATDVDHIKAVTGPNDPFFYAPTNHQALCHACHSRKTVGDGRWAGVKR